MKVSRTASLAARLGDVAHDHDRLLAGGRQADPDVDRIGRDLHPALGIGAGRQDDRAAGRAERRGVPVGVVELREDLRVALLLDVREDLLAGRVGQRDRAVRGAHDDRLAHRPDHRVELRRPGVLGLRQALEPDLDLDPLADVAGDGHDAAAPARQLDRLEHDLDRDRVPVRKVVRHHDGRVVALAGREEPDDRAEALDLGRRQQVEHAATRSGPPGAGPSARPPRG